VPQSRPPHDDKTFGVDTVEFGTNQSTGEMCCLLTFFLVEYFVDYVPLNRRYSPYTTRLHGVRTPEYISIGREAEGEM
jgi:hypothetical protein